MATSRRGSKSLSSSSGQLGLGSTRPLPLAERLRPSSWDQYVIPNGFDRGLVERIRAGHRPPPLILWGPPGSGKTTFARLISSTVAGYFVEASAVLVGINEIREFIAEAQQRVESTVLFIDEIHRFNKAQQDALLPHVERGTILLIGATTENPSFYCTGALLSRCHVVVFPQADAASLHHVLKRAIADIGTQLSEEAANLVVQAAGGDVRALIGLVELLSFRTEKGADPLSATQVREILARRPGLRHDKQGEQHYNIASAFIKSMRASDPDAALFWGFRLIEAGEDPRFVIRRMVIFASEDVGNADPRALSLATATADAFDRLGLPEGRIPIAQCITYLASTVKSNRSYVAMHRALDAITRNPSAEVPLHLRNAPTELMKSQGYGEGYEYPHDNASGKPELGAKNLPSSVNGGFYEPSGHGFEQYFKSK